MNFLWITLLLVVISTITALNTDQETDDNSLNANLNEDEDTNEFEANVQPFYGLRVNPKYYGTFHQLINKRIKGSEFLGKRMGSEFLGKRGDNYYKEECPIISHTSSLNYTYDSTSDIYGSQKSTKRLSEFLGGPGKRFYKSIGVPDKRRGIGGSVTPSYFLAKKLSEYLNSSFKRPVRFSNGLIDFYNPRGSEFLGGPGK
ncbi:uncharacterized protein LOC128961636 [Oppia nitens]|uniref:uncharacterized protein LOC128961636 n=1 Tax=Oppia nitens TaxID=1686743 RepID=UPI0023DA975D|nr:uncharacterized protein LOC128961636 [Oppia nitens]